VGAFFYLGALDNCINYLYNSAGPDQAPHPKKKRCALLFMFNFRRNKEKWKCLILRDMD